MVTLPLSASVNGQYLIKGLAHVVFTSQLLYSHENNYSETSRHLGMKDRSLCLQPICVSLIKKQTKTNFLAGQTLNSVVNCPIIHAYILWGLKLA